MTNTDFCFVLIRGKQIYKQPMSNEDIGRITKIIRNRERRLVKLTKMAKYDPVL